MTFSTFMRGIKSLDPFAMRFIVQVYSRNHTVSTHVDYYWHKNLHGFFRGKDMEELDDQQQAVEAIHLAFNQSVVNYTNQNKTFYKL